MTKVIWIARPIMEVCRSMKESGMPCEERAMRVLVNLRDKYWDYFDAVFDYDALACSEVMESIWEMCLPALPFDVERWKEYDRRNISYGKHNPYPQKDFRKFLAWVKKDMTFEAECTR